jgi:folate-dependent phosphoribosylglycinamide formyltransferase PurN
MRICITITEDPIFINPFIKKVIQSIPSEIIGIGIISGSLVSGKSLGRKIEYLLTIALISGPVELFSRFFRLASFKLFNKIGFLKNKNSLSISQVAKQYNIPVKYVVDINSKEFLEYLKQMEPDLIINQAQAIFKNDFLSIPFTDCLNSYAAPLPKYRGRLDPFRACANMKTESGISIHFIDEKMDNGYIVVQKQIPIKRFGTFDSLLRTISAIVPDAMLEATYIVRSDKYISKLIKNNPCFATYYLSPTFRDATRYRKVMLRKFLNDI